MVDITKSEIIQNITDRLAIAPNETPINLDNGIKSVFVVNEKGRTKSENYGSTNNIITISPPLGKRFRILYGGIRQINTATVGNRKIDLIVYPTLLVNVRFWDVVCKDVTTANSTSYYNLNPSSPDVSDVFATSRQFLPIPKYFVLTDTMTLKIYDAAAIDAADTFSLCLVYIEESSIA